MDSYLQRMMLPLAYCLSLDLHRFSTPAVSCLATLAIARRSQNGRGEISGLLGPSGRIGRVGID